MRSRGADPVRARGDAAGVVLVAGEALVDLVPDGADRLTVLPGGGPFNAARTVARLGQPATYLGCLSDDGFGQLLRAQLAADGVSLDSAMPTTAPTTLAVADVDAGGQASYRFYLEGSAAAALTPAAALAALPERVAALHVGTLGLVLEPLAGAVEAVADALAGEALVLLDPNCRPSAVADPSAYRARLGRMLGRADVVKASAEDLAWLEPGSTAQDAAAGLLGHGVAVVLVTCGSEGALVVTRNRRWRVRAPHAAVVDTIGAGDAFGGAFLAWWRMHDLAREELHRVAALEAAVRFACEVAARTCERPGAVPPRIEELRVPVFR